MKILANENLPRLAVEDLRALGHDVLWVAESSPALTDRDVLDLAVRERRVLLTMDKDFGELAFRSKLPADCGIVLVRVPPIPTQVVHACRALLVAHDVRRGQVHGRRRNTDTGTQPPLSLITWTKREGVGWTV